MHGKLLVKTCGGQSCVQGMRVLSSKHLLTVVDLTRNYTGGVAVAASIIFKLHTSDYLESLGGMMVMCASQHSPFTFDVHRLRKADD